MAPPVPPPPGAKPGKPHDGGGGKVAKGIKDVTKSIGSVIMGAYQVWACHTCLLAAASRHDVACAKQILYVIYEETVTVACVLISFPDCPLLCQGKPKSDVGATTGGSAG